MLLGTAPAWPESGAYRIEVLVFRYTDSETLGLRREQISDFPNAWRLFEPRTVLIPEDPAPLGVVSDQMRSAWNRLERTTDIEPLFIQTWEQSRIDYHPPVRVHDDQVLATRIHIPGHLAYVDLQEADLFRPYRQSWYRLDGTVQLRRTRFLHLDLDLEFRTELLPPAEPEQDVAVTSEDPVPEIDRTLPLLEAPYWNPPVPLTEPIDVPPVPVPGALLHRLKESRQIRSGELLYFDTPYLGVLARVTATIGE
jgi:hypothetical protein